MKIAVCDDEPVYRQVLTERILREGIAGGYETSITEYADGNALLAAVDRDGGADVYLRGLREVPWPG